MKAITILIITLFLFQTAISQNKSGIHFFPSEKVYQPLQAAIFESRIGLLKDLNSNELRLDIGASPEIIGTDIGGVKYSAGVDFFTFSNLRSEDNFKFPVDAIDYFFGVNLNAWTEVCRFSNIQARLRISHISSHFQDGHIYDRTDTIFSPFVYSREFIDIEGNYTRSITDKITARAFIGLEFLFSTIPKDFGKVAFRFGFESIITLSKLFHFYISDEASFKEVKGKSNLNNNLELGLKIGESGKRGLILHFDYYDGQDFKGQYFDRMISYKALGFKIDF